MAACCSDVTESFCWNNEKVGENMNSTTSNIYLSPPSSPYIPSSKKDHLSSLPSFLSPTSQSYRSRYHFSFLLSSTDHDLSLGDYSRQFLFALQENGSSWSCSGCLSLAVLCCTWVWLWRGVVWRSCYLLWRK